MAHADIAVQAIETLLVEYLVYKAHVLVVIHLAFGALGVADGDAALGIVDDVDGAGEGAVVFRFPLGTRSLLPANLKEN